MKRVTALLTAMVMLLSCMMGCRSNDLVGAEQEPEATQQKADITQPLTLELPNLPLTFEKPSATDGTMMSCTITDIPYEFHDTMIRFQFEGTENTDQTTHITWIIVDKQGTMHDTGTSTLGELSIAHIDSSTTREFVLTLMEYDELEETNKD